MALETEMRKSSITLAVVFHVLVLVAGMVSLPWLKKEYDIPTPVSVEIVDISEMAQTTKVAPKPVKEEKKEEKPPEKKPPPAPTNTATEPVTPVKDKVDEKKEELKKDEVLVDENAPPQKKLDKKDEKKKKVTQAPPKKDFSSVLKNLADTKAKPTPPAVPDTKPETDAPADSGENLPLGTKMTMTEMDALRAQLQGCWNVPIGGKDAENMQVDIFMVINPDRTLQSAKVVDSARYNSDSFFRAMADSAMRAVRNPSCSPFQLPADKYDVWKRTTVTFDPSQMF
ncbi:MAG: hypothetical protein PW788_08810 [Micavibrio sp.]|nr:hypothetical protein [Micavibrio sp.]